MRKDMLLEIGCENIPSGYIDGALRQLESGFAKGLGELRIPFESIYVTGTPNRLVVHVRGLASSQETVEETVTGPPVSIGVGEDGEFTRAAEGFARKQGVRAADLKRIDTGRGEYLAAVTRTRGKSSGTVLRGRIPEWISGIRFPKTMRWDSSGLSFARPVRWVAAWYGDRPMKLRVGDVGSAPVTRMSPYFEETTPVEGIEDYFRIMKESGKVIDRREREGRIRKAAARAAGKAGGRLVEDDDLCRMVANLVESPVAMTGGFDGKYLDLPREVVVTALKSHQRYFSVEDDEGGLLPVFISFADGATRNKAEIARGYERVLEARLADAEFYYREDTSIDLERMATRLSGIVWLEGLGTLAGKSARVQILSGRLLESWKPGDMELAEKVSRAARLAKADLASEMVKDGKEFTLLQGYIGREYARTSGEKEEIAEAIYEHYLPRGAGDGLPSTPTGTILALADRFDTIAGCYIQGLGPTGSQDPYALRRAAAGILRIAIEKAVPVDIDDTVRFSLGLYADVLREREGTDPGAIVGQIRDLFKQRMFTLLRGEGIDHDLVSAALSAPWSEPLAARDIAAELQRLRDDGRLEDFVLAMKRIGNILPPDRRGPVGREESADALRSLSSSDGDDLFDPRMLSEDAEKALFERAGRAATELAGLSHGEQAESVGILDSLTDPVNRFFEEVLVNCEDEAVRSNRLGLLTAMSRAFGGFCHFPEISG